MTQAADLCDSTSTMDNIPMNGARIVFRLW